MSHEAQLTDALRQLATIHGREDAAKPAVTPEMDNGDWPIYPRPIVVPAAAQLILDDLPRRTFRHYNRWYGQSYQRNIIARIEALKGQSNRENR